MVAGIRFDSIAEGAEGGESPLSYNVSVMIEKDLLEILVCPVCKVALEYRQNPETLKCTKCHRVYAVKDDIPNMLVDEAKIEP
jgi:uncharacterized protein YbaR (Trm112 family)